MKQTKISVTLDPDIAAELDRIAGHRGRSSFVNEAVRQKLQATRIRQMLSEMETEVGPIPEDVQRRVDALEWPD